MMKEVIIDAEPTKEQSNNNKIKFNDRCMQEGRIFQKPIHHNETKSGIKNAKSLNANRCDASNDYDSIECENNNVILLFSSENILLTERNDALNLEVDNAIEICEIKKITNN